MLYHPPKFAYNGLTIIMANPSRFDTRELLSAIAGHFFTSECLYPETNRYACDIRTRFCKEPFIAGTKVVLLLGEASIRAYLPELKENHLGELRGSPYVRDGICYIASYLPQDAVDPQDHESRLNPFLKILQQGAGGDYSPSANGGMPAEFNGEKDADPTVEKRRHGKTDRSNFRFWLKQDTKKALRILANDGKIPANYAEPNFIIYPNSDTVIKLLSNIPEGEYLDFDMETYSEQWAMTCFAFSIGDSNDVYVIPIYRHDYSYAYDKIAICKILQALAKAIRLSILVAHNGSGFDYLVLATRYRIPINRVFDTMIAAHRCYPEIEKSLGHQTSLWTYEPFHKDEINFAFGSASQANALWAYCGKDVWTMKLIRKAILSYAKRKPGLMESLQQAMDSIRPYMITTLQGIRYNEQRVAEVMAENDRLMNQYLRLLRLLTGRAQLLPTSNKECVEYFHGQLCYPVVQKSKKTGKPSLGEKQMLKLRLKFNNPAIDLCLRYRQTAKESGSLKFLPWKVD